MEWAGHIANIGGMTNVYKILVENPDVKNHPIPCRRHGNIKMDLLEI
jgi:hypothetical protein